MPKYHIHWIFTKDTFQAVNHNLDDELKPNTTYQLKARYQILISKDDTHFVTYQDCLVSFCYKPKYPNNNIEIGPLEGDEFTWLGANLTTKQKEIVKECIAYFETTFLLHCSSSNEPTNYENKLILKCLNDTITANRYEKEACTW